VALLKRLRRIVSSSEKVSQLPRPKRPVDEFLLYLQEENQTHQKRIRYQHPSSLTSSSAPYLNMSTLSQPQTPASLDRPSKEDGHKFVERLTDRLETPSLDDRKYRVVRLLPNQLEVLLVHDADTDKASAAMDVNVGNFSDEEDMQGMAHAVRILGSLHPIPFPHCTPETCIRSYTLGTS
jgi:hypothetical protein